MAEGVVVRDEIRPNMFNRVVAILSLIASIVAIAVAYWASLRETDRNLELIATTMLYTESQESYKNIFKMKLELQTALYDNREITYVQNICGDVSSKSACKQCYEMILSPIFLPGGEDSVNTLSCSQSDVNNHTRVLEAVLDNIEEYFLPTFHQLIVKTRREIEDLLPKSVQN